MVAESWAGGTRVVVSSVGDENAVELGHRNGGRTL